LALKDLFYTRFQTTLKPITVVHVWSGIDATVGIDAVYRSDGRLCIVDVEALPLEVVEKLASTSPANMQTLLARLADKLPCRLVVEAETRLPLGSQVKLIERTIVPGSSLKGYIRTALLYYLASREPNIAKILNATVRIGGRYKPKEASIDLENFFLRTSKPRKQGGLVDALQQLLVSDPKPVSPKLSLKELKVCEIPNMQPIAEVYAITMTGGQLVYDVAVLRKPRNPLKRLVREHSAVLDKLSLLERIDVLEALRRFGCDLVESEIARIKGVKELEGYVRLLEDLRKRYCGRVGECVVARIGFMTGHQAKTILNLVKRVNPPLYNSVKRFLSQYYGRVWDELTLKMVRMEDRLVGVGWCELCLTRL